MIKNPVNAPPKWAMKAVLLGLKIAWPVIAENKSKRIIPGIKNFAFTGTGKNINISLLSGKNIPNATRTPIIAPDAPTIVDKNEVLKLIRPSGPKIFPQPVLYLPSNRRFKTVCWSYPELSNKSRLE